jgi:gluconokinase
MKIIIMGVSGSGKTTVGRLLARELGWRFFDADDFHSEANRAKMAGGVPLTDEDRASWLAALKTVLKEHADCVLACSALKEAYRGVLRVDESVRFVYLKGTFEQVQSRLERRTGHYMPAKLLHSQFEALEEPADAVVVEIASAPEALIPIIRKGLDL